MKKETGEVLIKAEATYKDLLLRKNWKLRLVETTVFVVGMMTASAFFNAESTAFKVTAVAIAIAVVGLFPFLYKWVLRPVYTLTKTHLIISIAGRERVFHLSEVESLLPGRHVYRLKGKKESLMVSRQFLAYLEERLPYFRRKERRR